MRIDSAVKLFSERYDREAVESIDDLSRERGLVLNDCTIPAFNLNESFTKFSQYLKEYAEYKVKNINNEKASSQEAIQESVAMFIDTQLFREEAVKYADLPKFVVSYVDGIHHLTEAVEESKRVMTEANIDPEAIGDVNDFTDRFMDKLHESFDPAMDKILRASGYTSRKNLREIRQNKRQEPMFL